MRCSVKVKTHAAQKGARFPTYRGFKSALSANENGPKPRACDRRVKEGAIEEARGLNQHNSLLRLGTLQFVDRNGIRQMEVEHTPARDGDLPPVVPLHMDRIRRDLANSSQRTIA